ncbi:MAG: hypothetical protein AAGG01_15545, partial [Planctomycetota bacterium]
MDPQARRLAKDLFMSLEELGSDEREARLLACEDQEVREAARELLEASERAEGIFEGAELARRIPSPRVRAVNRPRTHQCGDQ